MSKQITKMWEVEDGKRYFLLQSDRGIIRTAIARAEVKYVNRDKGLIDAANIVFTIESGDATPGPYNCEYICEID